MATRGVADVVFCLDASDSMAPCIAGVRAHVGDFVASFASDRQRSWDLRFDFLAHSTSKDGNTQLTHSLHNENVVPALYGPQARLDSFFTASVDEFKRGLGKIEVSGNETPLIALDIALDYPWRSAAGCHRVVVLMSDEPFETGALQGLQAGVLADLIEKIQALRVMLFLVTPESAVFTKLSEVDRCEHWVVGAQNDGLASVSFKEVLSYIGKSVSVSTAQAPSGRVRRGLFGQEQWTLTDKGRFSE